MKETETKVVIMHGFAKEQIFSLMRAIKREVGLDIEVAFAMTTERSLKMPLNDVIEDVTEEHHYLKSNPPTAKKADVKDEN